MPISIRPWLDMVTRDELVATCSFDNTRAHINDAYETSMIKHVNHPQIMKTQQQPGITALS